MKVTFDTNALGTLAVGHAPAAIAIRDAILAGRLCGFFSETLVTLEGVARVARAPTFGAMQLKTRMTTAVTLPDGTHGIHVNLTLDHSARPSLHPQLVTLVTRLRELGFKAIRLPRIGLQVLDPAAGFALDDQPDDELQARLDRSHAAALAIEARGVGGARAWSLARRLAGSDQVAGIDLFRALGLTSNDQETKEVAKAVGEWADGDAVAAHIGHRHDVFCTNDHGKKAGGPSVLDAVNRAWLTESFGVVFMTLDELASHIGAPPIA